MRLQMSAALIVIALGASNASAGRLFGDVKVSGKPAAEGMLITVQAAPKPAAEKEKVAAAPVDSVKTDKFGSYKLMVKDEGKCTLTVPTRSRRRSLEVFSYKEATRYDLILEKKDGKLTRAAEVSLAP